MKSLKFLQEHAYFLFDKNNRGSTETVCSTFDIKSTYKVSYSYWKSIFIPYKYVQFLWNNSLLYSHPHMYHVQIEVREFIVLGSGLEKHPTCFLVDSRPKMIFLRGRPVPFLFFFIFIFLFLDCILV